MSQKKAKQQRKEAEKVSRKVPRTTAVHQPYALPLFMVLLITFLVYIPVFGNGFVNYDDNRYILINPMLPEFDITQIFSRYVEGNYHPLTMLVYSIEYQFFGVNPDGYHAVNLLIHLLNTALVFRVLIYISDKKPVALMGALLFGIHPLHVESVAWAAELKDLLYTFFFLVSWLLYLRYRQNGKMNFLVMAILVFVLSLLSKAMAASLPVVLLLTDFFQRRKLDRKAWLEKIPFFALAIVFGLIAINAQKATSAIQDIAFYSFPQRIVFACYGFMSYIIKSVIPYELCAYYPYPPKTDGAIPGWYFMYPFLFIGLVAAVIYSLRFTRKIFFGIGIFAATVFLVLQLLPVGNTVMADRYSYIPSIGIFYLFGEAGYWLWNHKLRSPSARQLVWGIGILAGIGYGYGTWQRIGVWRTSITLWDDVLSKYENVPIAHSNRGQAYEKLGQIDPALSDYNRTIELQPDFGIAYNNRGNIYLNRQKYDSAMSDYENSIRYAPTLAEPFNGKGVLLMRLGRYDSAIVYYRKALDRKPNFPEALLNMGVSKHNLGRKAEGCEEIRRAYELGLPAAEPLLQQLCK